MEGETGRARVYPLVVVLMVVVVVVGNRGKKCRNEIWGLGTFREKYDWLQL